MNPVVVFFALAGMVLVAAVLAERVTLFKRVGTAATSILFALVLSNSA